ncbi:hypothetical protein D0T12_18475 [Actinomadura spongiicola]|uniref:AAA+ ATPase domain-containing protein n=1 Tax=Actinomadura spongiicola TaxID=2303421 RepID=A0A372GFI1_9ACTN|nr:tetratricopeptide repeat protein [Actinomadura spongiicola]RFS84144.1 hypothetical protein D0T12_18475 [Actinomadura spongiicola]
MTRKVTPLGKEITRATDRLLAKVFMNPNRGDEDKFPGLARICRTVEPELWNQNKKTLALIAVIQVALQHCSFDRIHSDCDVPWRHISETLCGLRPKDELPPPANGVQHTYKDFRDALYVEVTARGFVGSKDNVFKTKVTRPFRQMLADRLLEMERDARQISESSIGEQESEPAPEPKNKNPWPEYIPRQKLHARFNELVTAGHKLIVLVGPPGMGKTWLAKTLTVNADGTFAPIIRIMDAEIHLPDLQIALSSCGIVNQLEVGNDPKGRLSLLFSSENAPTFVILDNLQSADEIRRMLPTDLARIKPTVVVTARRKGQAPPSYAFIDVGHMTELEAVEAIQNRLPRLSEDEAVHLASRLHTHPLLISSACTLLAEYDVPVHEFCDELEHESRILLEHVPTEEGESLPTLIQNVVRLIGEHDPLALEALACISLLTPPYVDMQLVREYLEHSNSASGVRYVQMIHTLEAFSIVQPVNPRRTFVQIHPLVQLVLRDILHDKAEHVIASIYPIWLDRTRKLEVAVRELLADQEKVISPRRSDLVATARDVILLLNTFVYFVVSTRERIAEAEKNTTLGLIRKDVANYAKLLRLLKAGQFRDLGFIYEVGPDWQTLDWIRGNLTPTDYGFNEFAVRYAVMCMAESEGIIPTVEWIRERFGQTAEISDFMFRYAIRRRAADSRAGQDIIPKVLRLAPAEQHIAKAMTFYREGRFDDAAYQFRMALAIQDEVLEEWHADTLATLLNLAIILGKKGDFVAAHTRMYNLLEVSTRVHGEEHLTTLHIQHNMTWVLTELERLREASDMCRVLLTKERNVLGDEHSLTLLTRINLARCLGLDGQLVESREEFEDVISILERTLGRDSDYVERAKQIFRDIHGES